MATLPRVYFDSNVFITAFESEGARSDHAWWLLDAVETGRVHGVTSELTLAEVLVKPLEMNDDGLAEAYRSMISGTAVLDVKPVDRETLVEAAWIRSRRKAVRLPDAIHLASARRLDCVFFVSGDMRLDMPEGIVQLPLNPFTLDRILVPGP
jgi:predicted nucleic acid-binding protein